LTCVKVCFAATDYLSFRTVQEVQMDIRSILVNVDLETADSTSLKYAIDLARKLDAELIGVAADEPNLAFVGAEIGTAAPDFYVIERTAIEKRLDEAAAQFRAIVPASVKSQWRAFLANPIEALIDTASRVDLIVTGATSSPTFQERRKLNLGELVIRAGRPVIDVANGAASAATDRAVIGWKDTREARRAVADALPLLKLAKEVTAITVSEGGLGEQSSLDDLAAWLKGHGISAKIELIQNKEGFDDVLETTAISRQTDLLITGGYGHTRVREWLFGGVTRNLLKTDTLTRFLSN
jgi:nucleotide-binding universal stress UspA family protein